MDLLQVTVLAIVQGLTEFLPISSSAHLVLVPVLTQWQDQGLLFDVALHVGTLIAVVSYFYRDILAISRSGLAALGSRSFDSNAKLFYAVGFATIPVGLAGLLFNDAIEANLRSPVVIAYASIGFGIILYLADRFGRKVRDEYTLRWFDVLLIGLAQALALIPGTSRSGATMTAGLMLGLSRKAAARFSFLLSIPVIVLAGGLKMIELAQNPIEADLGLLLAAVVISAVVAFLCIHYFLKLLDRMGMLPFVIYRILLGVVLLAMFYGH